MKAKHVTRVLLSVSLWLSFVAVAKAATLQAKRSDSRFNRFQHH